MKKAAIITMVKRLFSAALTAAMIISISLFYSPSALAQSDTLATVSAGRAYDMVIKTDGSLWAWGSNQWGALGDGTRKDKITPIKVMDNVASVSATENLSCTMAVKTDGTLWAWGNNRTGQIGDGTRTTTTNGLVIAENNNRYSPVKIMDSVTSVSAGIGHAAAIKTDGSLWVWGGVTLDGYDTRYHLSPIKVMGNAAYVSVGNGFTMVIKTDDSLWAWGSNYDGELGDGTTTKRSAPVKIMDNVASVSAGDGFALAVKTDGSLWSWGHNAAGELGDGTTIGRPYPVKIMDNAASVSTGGGRMAVGYPGESDNCFAMAVKTDGTLWGWGSNRYWEAWHRHRWFSSIYTQP